MAGAVSLVALGDGRVLQAQNLGSQVGGILGPGSADPYGSHRYSRRHLNDGQEGVHSLQLASGQGDSDDGDGGPGGQYPGQVGSAARPGYYHLDSPLPGV